MTRLVPLFVLFAFAGCRGCGGGNITARYGELVFVQPGAEGELLLSDATTTVPSTFMNTVISSEVLVRNVGLEEVTITSVTRDEGDESLSLENAEGVAVAGATDGTLTVRFAPSQAADASLVEVPHRARFTLTLQGAVAGKETLTLTVESNAVARDCFVPPVVDFGRVPLRHAVTKHQPLENGAALPATTTATPIVGADAHAFSLELAPPFEVPANGRVDLPLRFSPLEARAYEATFTLKRADQCPEGTVTLRGTGDDAALAWSPTTINFGRLPLGESSTRAVTLTNGSNADLSLTPALNSPHFFVEAGAPTVLPANGSATVQVSCKPASLGPLSAELTLQIGTTPVTPARVQLTCTGGGPRIRADPNPFVFGAVPYNSTGTAVTRRRFIVQNVGTAPPSAGDTSNNLFLGRNGSLPWFAIVPTSPSARASEFSVGLISTYDASVGVPAVAGKNFLEFEITLAPSSAGERRADLLIYSNDSREPVLRVPMTANPRAPEPCSVTVSPDSANFGSAPRGATLVRTFTVTNSSSTPGNQCLISGIEMAPGSNLAFRVSTPSTAALLVSSSQSQVIVVQATVPPDAETGTYLRGSLRFTVSNTGATRELPVDLQVSRCLLVAPPILDFGVVQENCQSAPRPVTLYNVCGVPITVTSATGVTPPFRTVSSPLSTGSLTLDPAATATLMLAAAPTTSGTWSETLRFDTVQSGEAIVEGVSLRLTADPVGQQQDTFTQANAAVDILFVIDDSCSMADEQAALASNFASFISAATSGAGDWQIGVTTTDLFVQQGRLRAAPSMPTILRPTTPNVAAAFAQNVQVGVTGSGFEQPFAAMNAALTEPNLTGYNTGFIRSNAALAVVMITDAVEQSPNTTESYISTLRALKNNYVELVNVSVVGPFTPSGGSCSVEGVDTGRYAAIVNQTNGARADICTSNWSMDLQNVSRAVFSARRSFSLSGSSRSMADTTVSVDGQNVTSGWRLDAPSNSVVFDSAPPPGSTVVIGYRTACF